LWQACIVALEVWDDESAWLLSHRSVEIATNTGTVSELVLALSAHIPVLVFCGDFAGALSAIAETATAEEATGIRAAPYGALICSAWRGQARESQQLIESTVRAATSRGEGIGIAVCEYARAVVSNGVGHYEDAYIAAQSASEHHEF